MGNTRSRALSAESAGAVRRIGFGSRVSRWDAKFSPYLYISPFFLLFIVTGLFPIGYTAFISFLDWDMVRGTGEFVGLDQYRYILAQPEFWMALQNTLSIFLLSTVPQLVCAIVIAAALDRNIRGRTFWRMSVLVPYVMAPVAVALIFSNMFGDRYGLVNSALADIGVSGVLWHTNQLASHVAIATMVNFRWTGYNTLILLAAMQAVPREYYEAATVDGAGNVRKFFSITLPSLKPTLIFVIVTATIGGLQIFDEPRMFDQVGTGGPDNQWLTISLYLYTIGWGEWNFGRAAALAWILFFLILVVGLANLAVTRGLVRGVGDPSRRSISRRQRRAQQRSQSASARPDKEETP
ncbi:MAG: carbohydrate ABC transporter permease [Rhodoglobus sp.]